MKKVRPSDSFGVVGWLSLDLYPCSELNFVLGEACFDSGCAVISFGHYADVAESTVDNSRQENGKSFVEVGGNSILLRDQPHEYPLWDCTNLDDQVVWRVLKVVLA